MEYNIPTPPPLPNNTVVESKINISNADNSVKVNDNIGSNGNTTGGKIRIRRSALEQAKEWYGLPDDAFEFMTTEEEIDEDIRSFNAMIEFERRSSNWW